MSDSHYDESEECNIRDFSDSESDRTDGVMYSNSPASLIVIIDRLSFRYERL